MFKLPTSLFLFLVALLTFFHPPAIADTGNKCVKPVVSGPPYWPPYVIKDEEGVASGMAISLIDDFFQKTDIEHKLETAKPWKRVITEFLEGEIDILYALLHSEERAEKAVYTNAWVNDLYAVVVPRKSTFAFKSMDSLKGKRGGYLSGISLPEPFGSFVKGSGAVEEISKLDSLFKMPVAGRIDYLIVSLMPFQHLLKTRYREFDYVVLKESIVRIPVYMAISKKSKCLELVEKLNKHLANYSEKVGLDQINIPTN